MVCESSDVVRFDLGPLLQGQTRIEKVESVYNSLVIGPRGLLCQINQKEMMGWECSDVPTFDLGPLLQGQTRTKVLLTCLLLVLEVYNVNPTCKKSFAGNVLMSDLTLDPSFKVKRWFTGFGELSFRWIQICISSPMRRS